MALRTSLAGALAPLAIGAIAFAGGTPEHAVLVVDPSNAESLLVANYYRAARDLPEENLLYFAPTPATYAQFAASTQEGFQGSLENLHLADHVDYVILPSGGSFYVDAPGLVADGCFEVGRFSSIAPFVLAPQRDAILAGSDSSLTNGYNAATDQPRAFRSTTGWIGGSPNAAGPRYYIGAMLGYTGALGNTLAEVLATIDRSVAADATHPAGTIYYMHTTDPARSGPRHGLFPGAVASIQALGGSAERIFADLPVGRFDCLGIMTGLADPDIDGASFAILPGAFCDHLTSYAATLDSSSQTKMTRWIARGASGTSGTVEEPCNYAGKFVNARLHVYYEQGLSLGESWLRSLGFAPFQTLFLGDPLTRPFAYPPSVSLAGIPPGPMSATVALTPSATTAHPTAQIADFELLVDGVSRSRCPAGGHFALDTTALADGVHEWRTIAYDDTFQRTAGRTSGTFLVSNLGRSAALSPSSASGNLTTRFDFAASASGGTIAEMRLLQGSRVVAASPVSPATLSVHGRILGAGTVRLVLEAEYADGSRARSAAATLTIADASGAPGGAAPVASSYTKHVLTSAAAVVELPATFDDALASASFAVLSTPAQATILGGSGPYRIVKPNAGAGGSDTMTFRATTPSGTSAVATVTLAYEAPVACPAPANFCTAAVNSSGTSAAMTWGGSTSHGANDLELLATSVPPRKFGIFFYGANETAVPLGNGIRCVASPFFRMGSATSNDFGDVSFRVDFARRPADSGAGQIRIGSTQRFQFWFRDPAGGGGKTNLTDGLAVVVCP